MQQTTIYRILTYILLPFAVLFGFFSLILFFVGLANPLLLLPVFFMSSFCIYSVASFIFLTKGIRSQQQCRPPLKDWIKVNGYVASALAIMWLVNSISVLFSPKATLVKLAGDIVAAQPVRPPGFTDDLLVNTMIAVSYVMLVFSFVLLIHLFINFKFLKKYAHVFGSHVQ